MNESLQERTADPVMLDRLVDGELPENERRQLLTSLDGRPGGWRQCALAFLEAQAFGQSLGEYVRKPQAPSNQPDAAAEASAPDAERPTPAKRSTAGKRRDRSWTWWLAVASSFLITLSLGMYVQQVWHVFNGVPRSEEVAGTFSVPANRVSLGPGGGVSEPQAREVRVPILAAPIADLTETRWPEQTAAVLKRVQEAARDNGVALYLCKVRLPNGQLVVWPIQQALSVATQAAGVQ